MTGSEESLHVLWSVHMQEEVFTFKVNSAWLPMKSMVAFLESIVQQKVKVGGQVRMSRSTPSQIICSLNH